MGEQTAKAPGLNRAKTYQLVLFPLNNGATNVYYVLVLSYIATFGSKVLALSMLFASVMVTGMRLFDAITDPIIGALMDRTNGKFGKFRPFMVIGNLIMAASILALYCLTPLIPASAMALRYGAFVALYAVWVIGYTFQTSCTRSGQTVLTNDPKQRPLFTIFNTVGSLLGMGAMQFFAPILAKNYEGGYASAGFFRTLAPVGIVISILLTLLAVIGIWEKDQPKYFGIGGEVSEKVKLHEYLQIIKNNNPMQRLMVAGAGCKLALSIATNTTVLCMLYGCMMGNYDGLNLPMMELGYVGKMKSGNVEEMSGDVKYSDLGAGSVRQASLEMKYSNLSLEEIDRLELDLSYGNANIGYLKNWLKVDDLGYSNMDIERVAADFERIEVESHYGNLNIGVPSQASVKVRADDMRYSSFDVNGLRLTKEQRMDHDYDYEINGGHGGEILYNGGGYGNLTIKRRDK